MGTHSDTPTIIVASFDRRDNQTYLRARTQEGVELSFPLEILGITIDGALREERDFLRSQVGDAPTPPAAPETTEGLEG